MNNRISKYFSDVRPDDEQAWKDKCEQVARDLEHDRIELEAGRMTVQEFDAKW